MFARRRGGGGRDADVTASGSFAAARKAVTSAAAARWRLHGALLANRDDQPVVTRYLIGKDVVFEAVHHVPPNVAVPLAAWIDGLRSAFTWVAVDLFEHGGGPPTDHPLGGLPLAATRAAFDDECASASMRSVDRSTVEVLERLQPYHLGHAGDAVAWFARLAEFDHRDGPAALGIRIENVRVHPASVVRETGATVTVAAADAALGHLERLVLARVRCPSVGAAATAHLDVHLELDFAVEVLGPTRGAETAVPLLKRMAMVEDHAYLMAVRLDRTTAPQ